jgi:hypothetical protein
MIWLGHGNYLHQSIRLWREGEAANQGGKRRPNAAIARFAQRPSAAICGYVRARAEADLETGSFHYRTCVVP